MKTKILSIVQIVLNLLCVPIFFLNIFVDVGVLQTVEGGVEEVLFYHSPYENLTRSNNSLILYLGFSAITAAIVLSALCLIKNDNRKLRRTGLILSVASIFTVTVAILFASTLNYCY